MYALYKQFHPPSGVECCASGNITAPTDINVAVTSSNNLKLYKVVTKGANVDGSGTLVDLPVFCLMLFILCLLFFLYSVLQFISCKLFIAASLPPTL